MKKNIFPCCMLYKIRNTSNLYKGAQFLQHGGVVIRLSPSPSPSGPPNSGGPDKNLCQISRKKIQILGFILSGPDWINLSTISTILDVHSHQPDMQKSDEPATTQQRRERMIIHSNVPWILEVPVRQKSQGKLKSRKEEQK